MKRKPYTLDERVSLLRTKVIVRVARSSATYSKDFKVFAVKEYLAGKLPMEIFLDAGIDVDILGRRQPQRCLARWVKTYKSDGVEGLLKENRGLGSRMSRN